MSQPVWSPAHELVDDAARAIAAAPAHDPVSRFEQLAWTALLAGAGPHLLTRHHQPMHLTASAAVLDPAGTLTCLVLHHKLGVWVQPGGHLEAGDRSMTAAAAREAQEETGLTGSVLAVPVQLSRHVAPCNPGLVDWHLDVQFLLLAEPGEPVPSDETPAVRWWPVDALPREIAPGVDELIRSAQRLLAR